MCASKDACVRESAQHRGPYAPVKIITNLIGSFINSNISVSFVEMWMCVWMANPTQTANVACSMLLSTVLFSIVILSFNWEALITHISIKFMFHIYFVLIDIFRQLQKRSTKHSLLTYSCNLYSVNRKYVYIRFVCWRKWKKAQNLNKYIIKLHQIENI